jgi:hypothetical protein
MVAGALVQWTRGDQWRAESIGRDLPWPIGAFLPSGHVVLASAHRHEVYDTRDLRVRHTYSIDSAGTPAAVISGERTRRFKVLTSDGTLTAYELP